MLGWVRAGVQVLDPTDTAKKLEGHPSCSAATPRPVSRRSGSCWTSATSCASRSTSPATATRPSRGCSPPKAPRRRRCRSRPIRRAATSAPSPRRAGSCCGWRTCCGGTSRRPSGDRPRRRPWPPRPPRLIGPVVLAMAGALAIGAGFAILASNGTCAAADCDENRTRNVAGGILIGAGAALMIGRHLRHDRAQPRRRPRDRRHRGLSVVTPAKELPMLSIRNRLADLGWDVRLCRRAELRRRHRQSRPGARQGHQRRLRPLCRCSSSGPD